MPLLKVRPPKRLIFPRDASPIFLVGPTFASDVTRSQSCHACLIIVRFPLAAAAYPVQNGPDVPAGRITGGGKAHENGRPAH
jgi:hypothetical protein